MQGAPADLAEVVLAAVAYCCPGGLRDGQGGIGPASPSAALSPPCPFFLPSLCCPCVLVLLPLLQRPPHSFLFPSGAEFSGDRLQTKSLLP